MKNNEEDIKFEFGFVFGKIYSIAKIAEYTGCTNANVGYHINCGHLTLEIERPKMTKYQGNNIIWIEHMKLSKEFKDNQVTKKKVKV